MKKEYDFTKAKLRKGPLSGSKKKLQKTIRLDEDVLDWLIVESKRRGVPYQTLMNSLLKQVMNQEEDLVRRVERLEAKLNAKKSG